VAGTRGFMSPEQERGEIVDASTDVFALGAMLRAILPPNLPRPLAAICARASATAKDDRYASVRALANDIANWLDDQPIAAYRENIFERARRWISRNRALVTIVLAYLVMRIIVILWFHR
jgi:serine/threonine protein kinase